MARHADDRSRVWSFSTTVIVSRRRFSAMRVISRECGRGAARPSATLDELREAVTTFEDAGRIARRVLGGAHPLTLVHESNLQDAQAALRARETPPTKGES